RGDPTDYAPSGPLSASAGQGADDEKRLVAASDRIRQRRVGRVVREVLFTRKESDKGAALLRRVVADRALERWVCCFEGIEHGSLRNRTLDVDQYVSRNLRQRAQVEGEYDFDHLSVWTSTDSTAGRSRTT